MSLICSNVSKYSGWSSCYFNCKYSDSPNRYTDVDNSKCFSKCNYDFYLYVPHSLVNCMCKYMVIEKDRSLISIGDIFVLSTVAVLIAQWISHINLHASISLKRYVIGTVNRLCAAHLVPEDYLCIHCYLMIYD